MAAATTGGDRGHSTPSHHTKVHTHIASETHLFTFPRGRASTTGGWAGKRTGGRAGVDDDNDGGGGDDLWQPQTMRGSVRAGAEVKRADSGVV